MKPRNSYSVAAMCCVALLTIAVSGSNLFAQETAAPRNVGVSQDWSQGHIVFSRDALTMHPDLLYREPRVFNQAMQRWQVPNSDVFRGVRVIAPAPTNPKRSRDWNVDLGKGRVSPGMFPAKFSFDPSAPPSCTNDFVVFGLSTAGVTAGQSNLVAFNNLYSGTGGLCGAAPTVMFAYNITTAMGGKIVTSPILSEDGTKIAFVESVGTSAIFHVLEWTAGQGTVLAAAAPSSMTSLTFSPSANSTTSSPWIDYGSDTVYLGSDLGQVYKITGVFKGTPTLAGSPWPVTLSNNYRLTPPVLDAELGVLMVGSANGSLYQINTSNGAISALVVGKSGGTSPGIEAAPIVDVTNGTTFVVSANGGTTAVLVEANTATMLLMAKAAIGEGATAGTPMSIYQPAFTNQYYNDPSSGQIRVCGTGAADMTPWQYSFAFTGTLMSTTVSFKQQIATIPADSTAARCTGLTEFYNPNVNGGTDFFFFGLTQDCTAAGTAGGCVVARNSDTSLTTATVVGGPSGIVVDNYSTSGQASSIYLSGEKVNAAYKFTQDGLQ